MVEAAGVRVAWVDLPADVRAVVEDVLGARVVESRTQRGGFSPGSADRVVAANGRRAFVKAVSSALNPASPVLHRREIAVGRAMPPSPVVPELLGSWEGRADDTDWVVLVLADVEGRQPHLPWRPDELEAVRVALEAVAAVPLGDCLGWLAGTGEGFAEDFAGWHRLRQEPTPYPDPWAARHLDRLTEAAGRGEAALAGDQLVHGDVRADNLLVTHEGAVVVVDWPWATRGAAWFDRLALLVNVGLYDSDAPLDDLLATWLPDVAPDDVDAVLSGLAAYFVDVSRRPDPPGLPTVRAFQRAQAEVVLRWLRRRWSIGSPA